MLHQSILPVHRQFSRLLSNLRYVVVDEGHAYRCPELDCTLIYPTSMLQICPVSDPAK